MTGDLATWHPFLVHFAVCLTMTSAVFDVLDFFLHKPSLSQTGFYLMFPAIPFLLTAVFTGNLAEGMFPDRQHVIEQHKTYANIAVWVFTGAGLWRVFLHFKGEYAGVKKVAYVFIVTIAAVSVFLAALKGGKIRHGSDSTPSVVIHYRSGV